MRLILTLTGGGSAVPEKDRIKTVSAGTISIGRGSGNDWVLPDPDRSLSKTHCVIALDGGRAVLTDTSTNGVFVNAAQQATERDSRVVLNNGDTIRLGTYVISVAAVSDGPVTQADSGPALDYRPVMPGPADFPATGGPALPSGPLDIDPLDDPFGRGGRDPTFRHPVPPAAVQPRGLDPFDSALPRALSSDPDDDLFRGLTPSNQWPGASRPDHVPAIAQAVSPVRVSAPPAVGDIDFDALIGDISGAVAGFAASPPPPPPPPPSPPRAEPPPLASTPDPKVPAVAAAPPGDPFNPFAEPALDSAPAIDPDPDPMAVTARVPPSARPDRVIAPSPPAVPLTAPRPPAPASAQPAVAATAAAPPPAGDADGARAAFRAFLDGAGLDGAPIDDSDPEAALRAAGAVFRAMTEGLREVLISRAAIKSEMRLEQTMIASSGNNALKFSVTADDAVAALLTPNRRGYMSPLAATREALSDIKSHELAVMAGVQTALLALLRRFDPDELEKRLTIGGLSAVLPGARKSRYWDGFRQTYGELTREAEDDFQSVFGRPFAKAYAAQTRKD